VAFAVNLSAALPRRIESHICSISAGPGNPTSPSSTTWLAKFGALVTNNYHQFNDPGEATAIKKSWCPPHQRRTKVPGLPGLGLAVVRGHAQLIDEIAQTPTQRLVTIIAISASADTPSSTPPRSALLLV
jgi:hypothetical protein